MTLIEAKETLAKVHMCDLMPVPCSWCKDYKDCKNCQLNVSTKQEQEAFEYLYNLMKERDFHG